MASNQFSKDLAELARAGDRKRDAALLRATTELFVLEETHDRDAIRRFEELATHFLSKVDMDDRRFVSERLASCVDAPVSIVRALARDTIEVAAPVIAKSPVLGGVDLLSVIAATDLAHYRLIASRPSLPAEVVHALRLTGDRDVLARLNAGAASIPDADAEAKSPGSDRTHPTNDPFDPWLFLGLDRKARLRIIASAATHTPRRHESDSTRLDHAFQAILSAAQIVGFARSRQLAAIIDSISEGLALPRALIAAAIQDAGGDLLAVMLKALRLTDIQARQVFLLASPSGQDVTRFFPLSDLYAGMEPSVAENLVAAWRDALAPGQHGYEAHMSPSTSRRAATAHEQRLRNGGQAAVQARRA